MIARSQIGRRLPPVSTFVEAGQLKLFAKATAQTNPIYLHGDAARAAGYGGLVAPPAFSLCLYMLGLEEPFAIFKDLWSRIERMLHAERRRLRGSGR